MMIIYVYLMALALKLITGRRGSLSIGAMHCLMR